MMKYRDADTEAGTLEAFRVFDKERTGFITRNELKAILVGMGETMTDEELQEMIDRADSNGDGAVTLDDFFNIMTKKTFA